ncbi:MAG: glycosyltransferase, partial [Chloroflexi bacterium]|nr:glycosyltransferase [Chloroflexota bacterium]
MRLLFLTPQLPYPPHQGTALRNWGLIHGLAVRHEITLLSFAEAGQTVDDTLRAICRRIVTVPVPRRTWADRVRTLLFSREPDMARRLASDEFRRALLELLDGDDGGDDLPGRLYDAAHIEGIELAAYLPDVSAALHNGITLYDAHNAETLLQQRAFETDRRSPNRWPGALYSLIQSRRLAHFESETLRLADRVLCVSEEDSRALRSLVPTCDPVIIPNGIHLSGYDTFIQNSPSAISHQPSAILFTGKMDYRPNVDAALWFADAIFPRIRAARPEAQFVVVGQRPHARLNVLAGRPGIVLTGTVSDIRPYLAAAAVYVAPLRMGGGTRFKLLEAMAMRKAIVSTTVGAEGFAAR